MRHRLLLFPAILALGAWTTSPAADTDEAPVCPGDVIAPAEPDPEAQATAGPIELVSGGAEFTADGEARFTGPVEVRSGNRTLTAEGAVLNQDTGEFRVEGEAAYSDPATRVTGRDPRFDQESGKFRFDEAEFELLTVPARGTAGQLRLTNDNLLNLDDVSYTACPKNDEDWLLKATEINIDRENGFGTARNARLEVLGVPALYLPYITFPVGDERRSGFLMPDLGNSDQRGLEATVPWYWNIAPNADATFFPRYMSKRGFQLGSDVRYLFNRNEGNLYGDFLPDDDRGGENRFQYDVLHQANLGWGWRGIGKAKGVSDSNYFEDFATSLDSTSQTNLERKLDIEYYDEHWSVLGRVRHFQTIDDAIANDDQPYKELPRLGVGWNWRDGPLGLDYRVDTEAAAFDRDDSVTGLRTSFIPEVALPVGYKSAYFRPSVALDYTRYDLDDQPVNQPDDPDRTLSVWTADTGVIFDRTIGGSNQWLMTLEPRAQYVYIPFEDQQDLPIFDTIEPDLNLVQLFRTNRYIGRDRIGDTNQLAVGITTRVTDPITGDQFLSASIGQAQYFTDREVTLPGESVQDDNSSDYLAELDMRIYENWRAKFGYQYNSDDNRTEQAEARVRWQPDPDRLATAAYRYRDGSLEQADFGMAWPLNKEWSMIGRINYSLLERESLEQLLGISYETCCWGVTLVGRNYIRDRSGDTDTSITLRFELKGFSQPSDNEKLIERGILAADRF